MKLCSVLNRCYQLTCVVRHFKTDVKRAYPLYLTRRSFSTPTDRSSMEKVHVAARDGFKQGHHYDQNRPSYTEANTMEVVNHLYRDTDKGIKYNILELGAGTGIFTRQLIPHVGEMTFLASDPSEDFLRVLTEKSPEVETQIFSAYKIPLPDNSVQNIVCAQCFHWCANPECLAEITRVLVPKGRVLCVWNHKNWDIDWVHELEEVLSTFYKVETPRAYLKTWFKVIEAYSPMKRVQHLKLPGMPDMKGDKEFIVDHFTSISVVSLLEEEEKKVARSKFRAVLDKYFPDATELQLPLLSEFYCSEKN